MCREDEGIRLIKEMKERYSAIASTSGLISDSDSVDLSNELVSQTILARRPGRL